MEAVWRATANPQSRFEDHASAGAFLLLVPPDPGLSRRDGRFLIRLFENQLSMLKAKGPWRHARHLVEAPREVTLVGESSCEGDVNERQICVREQLLRAQ